MDKGKSKTDLRAAGKKRLEEFRQKRQLKGSSTKSSSSTALKALTESERNSGDNAVEEISRRDSLISEESQRSFSPDDGEVESIGEIHEVNVGLDASPASSVTSSIQRLKVGGGHLVPETSEQSVESPCEPGSSNGNLEDKDREAVYTILWENHGTDHSQRHEDWQESAFNGGPSLNERLLDQGNYSTFRVDDESYGSESVEGLTTQRKSSGNSIDALEKFQSSEGIHEWDEPSRSSVPSQQRHMHDSEAENRRNDVLHVDSGFKGQSSFSNEESIEDRMLPGRDEKLEKENADMVSEVALLLQKLEQIVTESGREREFYQNEISFLKSQGREKDEAASAKNAQLEELEAAKSQCEQLLRTALERTAEEKEQLLQECMDVKSRVGRLNEERDKFLSSIDAYDKELEVSRTDSATLAVQLNNLSEEANKLSTELSAAREQAAAALEHEAQLLRNIRQLEEDREVERTRLQSLELHLEDILTQKAQLEISVGESANVLEELRVLNKLQSEELAASEREFNVSRDFIKTLDDEKLKFHVLVENLTRRLSIYEEKEATSEALSVQMKDSETECKRLHSVIQNLEINLHSLQDEKEGLDSKYRVLQVEKKELSAQVESAKNELKSVQCQLEGSQTLQSEMVEELTTVKLELTRTLEQKSNIQVNEEESRQKLARLEDQFGKLEIERNQMEELLVQKLQFAEENYGVLEEQKVGLEELLAGTKHDLEQLNEQLRNIDAEKLELKETSAIAVEALEQRVRRLGGDHSELEELCRTLRVELQFSQEKVSTLVAEKIEMEATAEMLHRKVTGLVDHNSELDQRFNVSAEEKALLVGELASSQLGFKTVHEEKVLLESELRLLQEELESIREEKKHILLDWETFQEKLKVITSEKVFVVNQLKESQHALQILSEESGGIASELSAVVKKLDDSTELNNKLSSDLQSLQERLQESEAVKSRVEIELEESLSKLNDGNRDKTSLSNKLDTLLRSVEALEIAKVEFSSQVQQLQETVNLKEEEISICKEERKQQEVDSSAMLENEVARSHGLITEICNLKSQLRILEQQLLDQRHNQNYEASDEPSSPTSRMESENLSLADFENASPRSHAANVKFVKKLVEVFEGKANDDVPFQSPREIESPVAKFLIQAKSMKKTTDDLQRDRDTAMLAETTLRADLDSLTKNLQDVSEEKHNFQAIVSELQEKLAGVTADCSHLNQIIDKLMNGDGEGVKAVAVLQGDKSALQAQTLELSDRLRVAEESIRSLLVDQSLTQDLQKRCEELDADLETERDASKKILNRMDFLSNYIEEQVLTIFPKLEWTSGSGDPVSQVEYKMALVIDKVRSELVAKVNVLERERDLAMSDLHVMTESKNVLQVERGSLISEKEALKAELVGKVTTDAEARVVYEGHVKALSSSLEKAEIQLNFFKNERTNFEKKLLVTVNQEYPDREVELSGAFESTFDSCWFLVGVILEGTSKKLEDMEAKLLHENSELTAIIAEERLRHQSNFVDVESLREVLRQERDGLFEKVKLLETEVTLLQEEQERVSHEYQHLLELEAKAKADRQEQIQMLESTVDDLQRGSEEREAEESEARSAYERDMKSLNSRLKSIQSELDNVTDLHIRFDEKLESAARQVLPIFEVKPVDFKDNLFDYSWAIVNLILEEYSRRLQHARADLTELESKVNSGKEEEIRVLQELVQRISEELVAAKEERNEVSEKVRVLEEERMVLQEEQERAAHELEVEAKAKADRQEKIQILESTVDDLQRGLEEREVKEAESRFAHEEEMKVLNSRLQSIENELDKVRDLHTRFDEKLESAAREVLPIFEINSVGFEDNLFDYSWAIVNLVLEEYSRRLQHALADMKQLENKLDSGKEEEIRVLQELVQRTAEELAVAKEEKGVALSELAQSEKRLSGTKERLTLAINKGKSIVVQRDAVKASLAEKTGELQRVDSEYKEMMELKDIALQEAEAAALLLKAKADQAELLEKQLVDARVISERLENSLSETRCAVSDMEIAVDKITPIADHVWETRVAKVEWVAATLKDLQMRLGYYETKTESLVTDLTSVSNEKEALLQKLQDVSLKCKQLEKTTGDDASSIASQVSEIKNLHEKIVTMEAEAAEHIKMQHAVSMAVGVLYSSGQDTSVDSTVSNSLSESEVGLAVNFHVNKYKSALLELDELKNQSNSLVDAIEKMEEERAFVSAEKLQNLQGMLQARDFELRDVIANLGVATRVISEREEESKVYVQQKERLNEELIKCQEDLETLKLNSSMAEKKMIDLKDELHEVIYSFRSVPEKHNPQVEDVTLSMNDVAMDVIFLVKTIVDQAHKTEMESQKVHESAMAALLLESSTNEGLLRKFEREFLESRTAAQGITWLHRPSPPSPSLLDWVSWLIDALHEEHRKFEQALQEIESMTKTVDENAFEVQHLQERNDSLFVELSNQHDQEDEIAENLRRRDLEVQILNDKLQELGLQSDAESARSMAHVEKAVVWIEEFGEDFPLQGRPSSTSSPLEWISWLTQIIREVRQELKTSKNASDALSLNAEEAKNSYTSLYEELLRQKDDSENLQNKLREVHETFSIERDSLKAEIQVLKDSSMEVSRREFEFLEAHNAVTKLQEALTFKDRELSELRDEVEELSLRSAQQDSKLQILMEERERLSSEVVDEKASSNHLQAELVQSANEKRNLQSDISQLEQKLVALREKLNLAISKGKGLAKQRDSLKQSLAEETGKLERTVSSHSKEIQFKDSKLLEAQAQTEVMGSRVEELRAEVSSFDKKATAAQRGIQAERERLESAFSGIKISRDMLSRDPVQKVEWLISQLEGARNTGKFLEVELDKSRNALETLNAVLKGTEERLQSVTVESLSAQDEISLAVKKAEEAESRATFDRTQYENEVDGLTKDLKEAMSRQQAASSRVKELEKSVEKHQNTINASEAARSKTVSKLTFTRNKLNLLVQDSQELVRECESLHKSLQERDSEIVELNHEVDKLKNIIRAEESQRIEAGSETSLQLTLLQEELAKTNDKFTATVKDLREIQVALQSAVKERDSELDGLRTKIEDILLKGDNELWMEQDIVHQNKGDDNVTDVDIQSMNGSQDLTSVITTLERRFDDLVAETQLNRNSTEKKEAQILKLKKELHDISIEKETLQAGVQSKSMEVERLRIEVDTRGVPVEDNTSAQSEIDELGTRSTWVGTGNSATPHVRGPRRHSQADIAIDMDDADNSNLLGDMNDKEHGFSALTNSRLVPKATRILADRLDGLWFAGGRVLTRQPSARLGLALYWIFIHVYIAMVFSGGML